MSNFYLSHQKGISLVLFWKTKDSHQIKQDLNKMTKLNLAQTETKGHSSTLKYKWCIDPCSPSEGIL